MLLRRTSIRVAILLSVGIAVLISAGLVIRGRQPTPPPVVAEALAPVLTLAATPEARPNATIPPAREYLQAFLEEGIEAQRLGDYEQAAAAFRILLLSYIGRPESVEAAYQLGIVEYLQGNYDSATQTFRAIRAQYSAHPRAALTTYWLAESLAKTGRDQEALRLFKEFIATHPEIEDLARLRRTVLLLRTADNDAVLEELELFDAAPTSLQVSKEADLLHGQALMRSGAYAEASAKFQALVANETGGRKLSLLNQLAEAQQQAGRVTALHETLGQIVQTYPAAAEALTALKTLGAAADYVLTPYQIGRSYYFHYQNDLALTAFERQQQELPYGIETPWARYRTAIIYERNEANEQALEELAAIVEDYPYSEAAQDAQWEYGWLLDYLGRYEEASLARQRFRELFSASQRAQDSLIEEALSSYRARDYQTVVDLLNGDVARTAEGETGARAAFWKGKALDAWGYQQVARRAYEDAALLDPGGYYAFRSLDQQGDSTGLGAAASLENTAITAEEEAEAALWLREMLPNVDAAAITSAQTAVSAHRNIVRAELFYELGQWGVATEEYRTAVREHKVDAEALFALATLLYEREQYGPAMLAIAYLKDLTSARTADLPPMLQKVLYPAPYTQPVVRAAREYGVDPLLMYALIRQESLFNPWAAGGAQERGLTQVIPSTGEGIAASLGVTDFALTDLYRPVVSIRFGSYYLSQQLATFRHAVVALAAYNGGPSNAHRWGGGNPNLDPDLFVENIDYPGTRSYARLVQQHLGFYRQLYGGSEAPQLEPQTRASAGRSQRAASSTAVGPGS